MKYAGVVVFLLVFCMPSAAQYDEGYACLSPVMPGQMGAFESEGQPLYGDPLGSGTILVESLPYQATFNVLEGPVCPDERDGWIKIDYAGQVGWFLVTQYGLCEVCPDDPPQFWAKLAVKPLVPIMIGPNDPRLNPPVNTSTAHALTPANVAGLVPLKTWGEGALRSVAWTELGQLRLITTTEDRLYDPQILTQPASIQTSWQYATKTSDGRLGLIAQLPNTLTLRDAATGQDLAVLEGTRGVFDAAGRMLAVETGGQEPEIRVYDLSQPGQPRLMQTFGGIRDTVVFKDGWLIGASQETIFALNLNTGEATSFLDYAEAYGFGDGFVDHSLSPDGSRLAMLHERGPLDMGGGFFERVLIYGVGQLPPYSVYSYLMLDDPLTEQVQQPQVRDLIWSPDGETLIVAMTDEQKAYRRRAEDGIFELDWTLTIPNVVSAAYSPDGALTAFATSNGEVYLMRDTQQVAVLTENISLNQVITLAFSPDGRTLAVAGQDSVLTLWDTQTAQMTDMLALNTFATFRLNPEETQVQTDRRIYDLTTGELVSTLPRETATNASLPYGSSIATVSKDQTLEVVRERDAAGTIRFYVKDRATGETLRMFEGYFVYPESPRLSPDNRLLAIFDQVSEDSSAGSQMLLFDVQTGDLLDVVALGQERVDKATFSGDGKTILMSMWGNHDQLGVYDLVVQEQRVVATGSASDAIALNYDGSLAFASNREGTLVAWNTATGEQIAVPALATPQEIKEMIMGKDGSHLYTVNQGGVFTVWGLPQ